MDINDFGACENLASEMATDRCKFAMAHRKMSDGQIADLEGAWKDGFMAALAQIREGKIKEVRP